MKKFKVEFADRYDMEFDTYEELCNIEAENGSEAIEIAKDWLKDQDTSDYHKAFCTRVDNMVFHAKEVK